MKTLIISGGRTRNTDPCITIGDVVKVCDRDTSDEFYAYAVHDDSIDDCTGCALQYVQLCAYMRCASRSFILKRIDNIVEDI